MLKNSGVIRMDLQRIILPLFLHEDAHHGTMDILRYRIVSKEHVRQACAARVLYIEPAPLSDHSTYCANQVAEAYVRPL